ncbi:hypothetical protein GCM10025862_02370 [Arsenicicoccus piscis]|uniref:RmlD-like substrate binding domain-containing protein n=1 Tax=Arsenicicoccus piscis TaxID=673954 RepID=A0ABQ6HHY4_9MICO|nr:hypothetical protein GCM10025862_02370 [Arsenicicoccus piscis]
MAAELSLRPTSIPGLVVLTLPVHGDDRGFFKENWQRAKMVALGLPDLEPVQNNVSFNATVGVTRGFHAEPWNKLVSVATGKVFGAWVDLREGETFGRVETVEIDERTTVFVPAGVANAFQTLEPGTAYSYLVDDHWSPAARDAYTYVNLADPTLGVGWPVPLDQAELSDADRTHPMLADVTPMRGGRVVVVGSGGQVGQAFAAAFPHAELTTRAELDLADPASVAEFDWTGVRLVLNAAAYTKVDAAETPEGRRDAWAANATGVAALARVARERHAVLVHVSSDYVFDGTADEHTEDESLSPLGVYGQSKAAGDLAALEAGRVYILRSSWVVGAGGNFVRTMVSLADKEFARASSPTSSAG